MAVSPAPGEAPRRLELRVRPRRGVARAHPSHPARHGARTHDADVLQDERDALTAPVPDRPIEPIVERLAMGARHAPWPFHLTRRRAMAVAPA